MNMTRHDHIAIHRYDEIFVRELYYHFFRDLSVRFQDGRPVPYDVAEDPASFVGADRNKVGSVLTVIVFVLTVLLSLRKVHTVPILCGLLK